MNKFFRQFSCKGNNKYSVVIEDDGRVCYAYLMEHNNIIGDVWLYNSAQTPPIINWSDKNELPFLNPAEFVDVGKMPAPPAGPSTVEIEWQMSGNAGVNEVTIYIQGRMIAKIKPGSKPGWSTVVRKDGPLAKKVVE